MTDVELLGSVQHLLVEALKDICMGTENGNVRFPKVSRVIFQESSSTENKIDIQILFPYSRCISLKFASLKM